MADSDRLDQELARLRRNGMVMPRHPYRAAFEYGQSVSATKDLQAAAGRDLERSSMRLGRPITQANYDSPEVQAIMRENKALTNAMGAKRGHGSRTSRTERISSLYPGMPKTSMMGGGGTTMGGDVMNAVPRFYDPLEYWDLSGLPWNIADEGHRHKLHKWLRLYYATHYLVPILVDIFTRFPLVGMELQHKDAKLKSVYEDIFLDQLDYEEFLVSMGREYWCVGEAFPLGSFDEDLGIWEHEELINPEDVVIDNFPLLASQQLKIVPPDYLRRIAQTKSPAREWYLLQQQFEDLIPYLLKGEHIPISPVMLRQVANKLNDWDDHGTPILMRGLRTLLHEEKLMASQDAIAERLYSPFILAKLGIMDMGDGLPPWLPGPEELESVRDDIDMAMASDFRVMVHHFGLEMTSVFGREQMPRLGDDFDRIERRLMQVFGVNPSLLSAGTNSQPYASSALQAEFMNQILRTFQKMLKNHFKERALVVAEAQGHYEYERKGKTRIPIYENVVTWNEDGEKVITRQQKLTVPDLDFATFDLRDEATERNYLQQLREAGIPIPDDKMMIGISWSGDDYVTTYNQDIMRKTVSQQRAKMDTYITLVIQGLPVPLDLKAEVESVLVGGATGPSAMPSDGGAGGGGGPPPGGGGAGGGPPGGAGGMQMPPPPPDLGAVPGGGPPAAQPMSPGPPGSVPDVSNERRPGLTYNTAAKIAASEDRIADDDTLAEITAEWPEDMRKRAVELRNEITGAPVEEVTATASDIVEDESETEDPETWVLKSNQALEDDEKGKKIIVEGRRKRPELPIEASKKYSIIDPLALQLEEEDSESPTDAVTEPTGQ